MHRRTGFGRPRLLFVLSLFIFSVFPKGAKAIDRIGYVGVSVLTPFEIDPDDRWTNETYGIDVGFFLSERWTSDLFWNVGVTGDRRHSWGAGSRFYLLHEVMFNPYLTAKVLIVTHPKNDLGWRANIGGEWNLAAATGLDNLRLYVESGASQIYLKDLPDELAAEVIRIGLAWNY